MGEPYCIEKVLSQQLGDFIQTTENVHSEQSNLISVKPPIEKGISLTFELFDLIQVDNLESFIFECLILRMAG